MIIKLENGKEYDDKKQALIELAFSHYPLKIWVDSKEYSFDWFSDLETFIKNL